MEYIGIYETESNIHHICKKDGLYYDMLVTNAIQKPVGEGFEELEDLAAFLEEESKGRE